MSVVHAVASQLIRAAPERVSALYQDYGHWPDIFPLTIRGTRLIRENDTTKAIEVDHTSAGRVLNLMTVVAPNVIRLEESKPHYDATFTNQFDDDAEGTRYTVVADVHLKGALRLFTLLARPIIRRRLARFVLQPMKATAEARGLITTSDIG